VVLFGLQHARPILQVCACASLFLFPFYVCASKVTEIGRISVVMYVLDHFLYGKLQLTSGAT